jgi:hypothetical protein
MLKPRTALLWFIFARSRLITADGAQMRSELTVLAFYTSGGGVQFQSVDAV